MTAQTTADEFAGYPHLQDLARTLDEASTAEIRAEIVRRGGPSAEALAAFEEAIAKATTLEQVEDLTAQLKAAGSCPSWCASHHADAPGLHWGTLIETPTEPIQLCLPADATRPIVFIGERELTIEDVFELTRALMGALGDIARG